MIQFREVIVLEDDQEPPGNRKRWEWFGTETIGEKTYVAWRAR